jgi:hypothetical protein
MTTMLRLVRKPHPALFMIERALEWEALAENCKGEQRAEYLGRARAAYIIAQETGMMPTCHDCNGSGINECFGCEGDGKIANKEYEWATCGNCFGRGRRVCECLMGGF